MPDQFDPYYKWLGIRPEEQPPNHYRLLAIGLYEADLDVIASAVDQRMAHVKAHHIGKHAELSQQLLNELSTARVCLLNPASKARYDAELRQHLGAPPAPATVPVAPASVPAAPSAAAPPIQIAQAKVQAVKLPEQASAPSRVKSSPASPAAANRRRAANQSPHALLLAGVGMAIVIGVTFYLASHNNRRQFGQPSEDPPATSRSETPAPATEQTSPAEEAPAIRVAIPATAELAKQPAAMQPNPPAAEDAAVDRPTRLDEASTPPGDPPTSLGEAPASPGEAPTSPGEPRTQSPIQPPTQPPSNDNAPPEPPAAPPDPVKDFPELSQELHAEFDGAKTPAEFGAVATHALELVKSAAANEYPVIAERVCSLALSAARKSGDKDLVNKVTRQLLALQEAADNRKRDAGK